MCAHNASGHGIGCRQAIHTPYQSTNTQARASPNKFHHLMCECAHTMREGIVVVVRPYVHIYIVTNIQVRARPKKICHLTFLKDAHFAHQLENIPIPI